jgi:hypothetical protein
MADKKKKKKKKGLVGLISGKYFSPRKAPAGLKLRKYDPVLRKHVEATTVKTGRV